MADQQQEQEQVEEKVEDKNSNEELVSTQPTDTQKPLVSVNVNVDDNQKEKTNEKQDEEAPTHEQIVEIQPPPIKDNTK